MVYVFQFIARAIFFLPTCLYLFVKPQFFYSHVPTTARFVRVLTRTRQCLPNGWMRAICVCFKNAHTHTHMSVYHAGQAKDTHTHTVAAYWGQQRSRTKPTTYFISLAIPVCRAGRVCVFTCWSLALLCLPAARVSLASWSQIFEYLKLFFFHVLSSLTTKCAVGIHLWCLK